MKLHVGTLLVGILLGLKVAAASVSSDTDLVWRDVARSWHQQTARIVDHRFTDFATMREFALSSKKAGVSVVMLVQIQRTEECPGDWYNGLQLCAHINGDNPAADGTIEQWQQLTAELKPTRLMWWNNPTYWSVQGSVWEEAKADKLGKVGQFFTWNVTDADACWGNNPVDKSDGVSAQGSWACDGAFSGIESAMASFGSETYATYLVDALANSWTKNLGIEGYTIDVSASYPADPSCAECPNGMLQCGGDAQGVWAGIVDRVRELQPHVVLSGEYFNSWEEVMHSNSDIGGQGWQSYHDEFQAAVKKGDASGLEQTAANSGSDSASVLCYLHPKYDGKQPGECATMYFRDTSAVMEDVAQHTMWVAMEAASGIVSEHDYDPNGWCTDGFNGCSDYGQGAWWNCTEDPFVEGQESPLQAFMRYRALNRLSLRTKLGVVGSNGADATAMSGGALAYLKHDSMGPDGDAALTIFNPGPSQNVTLDLSLLPAALTDGTFVPVDLIDESGAQLPPLASAWTIEMGAGEMRFVAGFSLGVFAPRKGKKGSCVADDGYIKAAESSTLQGCFLECSRDAQCENILLDAAQYKSIHWTESPPAASCTLLGAISDPNDACEDGENTLVSMLPDGRPK